MHQVWSNGKMPNIWLNFCYWRNLLLQLYVVYIICLTFLTKHSHKRSGRWVKAYCKPSLAFEQSFDMVLRNHHHDFAFQTLIFTITCWNVLEFAIFNNVHMVFPLSLPFLVTCFVLIILIGRLHICLFTHIWLMYILPSLKSSGNVWKYENTHDNNQ